MPECRKVIFIFNKDSARLVRRVAMYCFLCLSLWFPFSYVSLTIGSDHGLKAQGDGWLLTVALIEGSNLAAVDSSGYCDPYVVFTCNGKTRTSSIKYQKSAPQWNGEFNIILCLCLDSVYMFSVALASS